MDRFLMATFDKPNRLTETKDRDYHLKYGTWCASNGMNTKWTDHQNRIQTNKNFFLPNRQWCLDEDLEGFLKDDNGANSRNRLKVEMNYIQSMVNQYVGNSIRMNITARAKSISPLVKTRREEKLNELLYYTAITEMTTDDNLKGLIRKEMPIGADQKETALIFENVYVDKHIQTINNLLANGEMRNDFNAKKVRLSQMLALSGISIMRPYVYSGDYKFEVIEPDDFIFDRSAKELDLSDSSYQGEYDRMMPTEIYERFPDLDQDTLKEIEDYSISYSGGVFGSQFDVDGRIPVFTMYWRDTVHDTWGYVMDDFEDIVFARIDYKEEFEDKPRYKMSDVLNVSKLTEYQKSVVGKSSGKAYKKTYTDQWRYCSFIPPEIIGDRVSGYGIALEYGIMPYQEKNLYSSSNMATPYKVCTYIYIDGDIFSPVDIAINPQRMINRFYSVFENQVNNSGGSGMFYDPDMVEDEEVFLDAVANSKPAPIRSKGMPMQNVVSTYDNTIGRGTVAMLEFANAFKQGLDQITGVNEAMKGENLGSEQLVGVTQLMIQKGTVIQQRFYNSLEHLFKACYQSIASVGKRVYIQNKNTLINMVGDSGAEVLEVSADMNLEDFRVEVATTADPAQERAMVDQKVMLYLQAGLLDARRASNLLERATSIDLSIALREFGREKAEIERQTAEQQQMMAQQQMQGQAEQQEMQMAREDAVLNTQVQEQRADREAKLQETAMKVAPQLQANNA